MAVARDGLGMVEGDFVSGPVEFDPAGPLTAIKSSDPLEKYPALEWLKCPVHMVLWSIRSSYPRSPGLGIQIAIEGFQEMDT